MAETLANSTTTTTTTSVGIETSYSAYDSKLILNSKEYNAVVK